MSDTPDVKSCVSRESGDRIQAPYCSLHYHFGMLLGVADLETEQAYHRGKHWLHASWLHREGVVWGFDVQADPDHGELRVLPGLALDALGREIHLDADACLDVAAWFADRRKRAPDDTDWFEGDEATGPLTFDAHVVIRFKSCLTRQVPALAEPCESAGSSTAYSRRCETVEILLRPGLAPDPFTPAPGSATPPVRRPYHRLRLLFGLDAPERDTDGAIVAEDLDVLQAPRSLESFRRFAALDEIDLRPPEGEEFPVLLANVHRVELTRAGDTWTLAVDRVAVEVRPAHVATAALQDLLAGPPLASPSAIVLPGSVEVDANQVTWVASAALAPASIQVDAFTLTAFDPATGWSPLPLDSATLEADQRTVTLARAAGIPDAPLVRLIIHGTGPTPVLDLSLAPLNHGLDFIHDTRRS